MNRSRVARTLACIALVSLDVTAQAAERTLRLDPTESRVAFTLGATGHDVDGEFAVEDGVIRFDPASGAVAGEIRVSARSGNTGNQKRDRTMHRKVLESEAFPHFVLRPKRMEGHLAPSGTSAITLHGELELHGAVHPMELPMTVEIVGDRLRATTRFTVPFVEWGLEDPSFLFFRVAKSVEVEVSAAGDLLPPTTTSN